MVEFGLMSQPERQIGQQENESLWKSRLFKAGAVAAAVGMLINSATFLGIGAVAMGGAWTMKGGK